MKALFKIAVPVVLIASLAACGGGGSDPAPAPTPEITIDPLVPIYTQADIKNVANLAVLASSLTGSRVVPGLEYLGESLRGLADDTGGSREISAQPCLSEGVGSGTVSVSLWKTSAHTGLRPGEMVTFTYDHCDVGGTGVVVNGTASLVAQGAVQASTSGGTDVSFEATLTGFSVTAGALVTHYDGVTEMIGNSVESDTVVGRMAIPTGKSLSIVLSGGAPDFHMSYPERTIFAGTDATGPTGTSVKLDGSVYIDSSSGFLQLDVATPAALIGTTTEAGKFVATSGNLSVRLPAQPLVTSVVVNGAQVTISGDVDNNGSVDKVFTLTWDELVAP